MYKKGERVRYLDFILDKEGSYHLIREVKILDGECREGKSGTIWCSYTIQDTDNCEIIENVQSNELTKRLYKKKIYKIKQSV